MWRKSREEKRDYLNLTWLNRQYYELGRSLQDIADDQGVSMMTINKWVDKIEEPGSVQTEEKSFNTCPHCGQKLYGEAIFCIYCGKKVEESQSIPVLSEERPEIPTSDQLFPPISELLEDMSSPQPVTDILPPEVEEMPPIPVVSDKIEDNVLSEIPQIKTEEIQPTPPISEKWKEKIIKVAPKIKTEEIQPTPPIPEKIEKKPKVLPLFCKFCEMKLNKKATFCLQCGTKVKKK